MYRDICGGDWIGGGGTDSLSQNHNHHLICRPKRYSYNMYDTNVKGDVAGRWGTEATIARDEPTDLF